MPRDSSGFQCLHQASGKRLKQKYLKMSNLADTMASDSGPGGRWFESTRPDHLSFPFSNRLYGSMPKGSTPKTGAKCPLGRSKSRHHNWQWCAVAPPTSLIMNLVVVPGVTLGIGLMIFRSLEAAPLQSI